MEEKTVEQQLNEMRAVLGTLRREADLLADQRDILLGLLKERGELPPELADEVRREMAREAAVLPKNTGDWPITLDEKEAEDWYRHWVYNLTRRLKEALGRSDQRERLRRATERAADRRWAKLLAGEWDRAAMANG